MSAELSHCAREADNNHSIILMVGPSGRHDLDGMVKVCGPKFRYEVLYDVFAAYFSIEPVVRLKQSASVSQ